MRGNPLITPGRPLAPLGRGPQAADLAVEQARADRLRAEFATTRRVKPIRVSRIQIGKILRSGGAAERAVLDVLDWTVSWGLLAGPFDHADVWGTNGRPTLLVGHPYNLGEADWRLLNAIAELGLEVTVSKPGYYLHGTYQVVLAARSISVEEECERRNKCRAGLFGLRMRHTLSGREFVCAGSKREADSVLLLFLEPGHWDPGFRPIPDKNGVVRGSDVDLSHYHGGEAAPASECVLLERWPVVCCRPRTRQPLRPARPVHP